MQSANLIKKWRALNRTQKRYLLHAALVLTVIGGALKVLSFSRFKQWYLKAAQKFARNPVPDAEIPDIIWAVEKAAKILPFQLLCFPQSLAVKYLLGKSEGVVMHIGVNKDEIKGMEFHAWVEKKGKTIIGELPSRFQPLWIWD